MAAAQQIPGTIPAKEEQAARIQTELSCMEKLGIKTQPFTPDNIAKLGLSIDRFLHMVRTIFLLCEDDIETLCCITGAAARNNVFPSLFGGLPQDLVLLYKWLRTKEGLRELIQVKMEEKARPGKSEDIIAKARTVKLQLEEYSGFIVKIRKEFDEQIAALKKEIVEVEEAKENALCAFEEAYLLDPDGAKAKAKKPRN